ncbi:acyltransferase [Candidatus Saccharibacteria bacterium]|nr:acyltransferase [Candidatus Saccharibacteria bacterium]
MGLITNRKRIVGLDTLKLIAIILIVIYHCFPNVLPGGFLAVEIFFVISGFLIGQKLFRTKEAEKAKFGGPKSFLKFFWERLKRFLPTLVFCMIITLSLAYFADPDLLTNARANSLSAITFSTNIISILTRSNYENSLIPNLFNQTWFLALEMQICILLFLVLACFFLFFSTKEKKLKRTQITLFIVCLLISLVSFALMGLYGGWFKLYDRAYFGPDSHLGAFFLGAAFATLTTIKEYKPQKSKRWISWIILILCLGVIIAMTPFIHYTSKEAFIYGLPLTSILTCISLFLVLRLQPQKTTIPKLLKPFEYLGSLSFAIYLLHWGLYILLPNLLNFWPLFIIPYIAIAISIILAVILKEIIYPFSKKHKIIFYILLLLSLILPTLSLIKAPTKSSIEKNLEEAAYSSGETEIAKTDKAVIDYGGVSDLGKLLNNDVMQFFDASEDFAKPYPVVTQNYVPSGGSNMSGRAYFSAPYYSGNVSSYRVMVIGDSVVLGATNDIYNMVPSVIVDAMGSRNMFDAIGLLANYRANSNGNLPYIIVIGLITNYSSFGADTLVSIMDAAGPGHQFVFLTGYCGDYSREAQNATLRYIANSYGNVHIADWAALVSSNPGYYTYADHTHLNPAGRQAYANLISGVVSGL